MKLKVSRLKPDGALALLCIALGMAFLAHSIAILDAPRFSAVLAIATLCTLCLAVVIGTIALMLAQSHGADTERAHWYTQCPGVADSKEDLKRRLMKVGFSEADAEEAADFWSKPS